MTIRQVAPPALLAVTMGDARAALRLDDDDTAFDVQLSIWIAGITQEAEHATGRCFVNRPMRVTLDAFDGAVRLAAPTFSVESVRFLDVSGSLQTLDPAHWDEDLSSEPGFVVPALGYTWPATSARINAVTVDFTAGYGLDATAVPPAAKNYILARLIEQWDPVVKEFKESPKSRFIDRLLDCLKVYG